MSLVAGESISDATALRAGEPEARWYAVQTRSRFEKIVRADLTACGVENYLPSATEIHQWKDRKKSVEETLFPGYVFVRFSERGPARLRVLRTNGVVRILGFGNKIEPISDLEIDSIRRLLASGQKRQAYPYLREGSRVRVDTDMPGTSGRLKA